jgi:hypothetical protein
MATGAVALEHGGCLAAAVFLLKVCQRRRHRVSRGWRESSSQTRAGVVSFSRARTFLRGFGSAVGMDAFHGTHRDTDLLCRGAGAGADRFHAIPARPESRRDDEVSRSLATRNCHHRRPDCFSSGDERVVEGRRVRCRAGTSPAGDGNRCGCPTTRDLQRQSSPRERCEMDPAQRVELQEKRINGAREISGAGLHFMEGAFPVPFPRQHFLAAYRAFAFPAVSLSMSQR